MTVPSILLIDDEPLVAELYKGAQVRALSPADANFGGDLAGALTEADLILLDHNLNLNQTLGLAASDGASLVGHLRSWARATDVPLPPIAIYTSADDAFSDETPVLGPAGPLDGSFVGRQARLAPALDVEWLISKVAEGAAENAIALAQDSLKLRQMAGDGRMSLMETVRYLGLPAGPPWSEIAFAGIARWRPPISEAGAARLGARGTTATLRWLLHQILPCPGLLIPSQYAAWSLGVELDGFEARGDPGRSIGVTGEEDVLGQFAWAEFDVVLPFSGSDRDPAIRVYDAVVRVRQDRFLSPMAASLARNSAVDSPARERASSRSVRA